MAYPPEDLQKLFTYLSDLADPNDIAAIRDLAILRLAYVTGLREGEIANLPLERLDLEGHEALILAQTSKAKKLRRVYFDDQVYRDLVTWLKVRPDRKGVREIFVSLGGGRMPHTHQANKAGNSSS